MICKHCKAFFHWIQAPSRAQESYESHYYFHHARSYREWETGIARECALCKFLYPFFDYGISQLLSEKPILVWLPSKDDTSDGSILANITTEIQPYYGQGGAHSFRFVPVQVGQDRMDLTGDDSSSNTPDSTGWLKLARHWLETCLHEHTTCERPKSKGEETWKPTRLIYIDESHNSLRLVTKDHLPSSVHYATLSHCWGKIEEKLILTVENIEQWKEEIPPFGKLKTFQDAAEIARQLGLQYIWIDSLCIIQNSTEDWQRESSQMSNVYKYSYCNISATAAGDDTGGCFPSKRRSFTPLRVEFVTRSIYDQLPASGSRTIVPTREGSLNALLGRYDFVMEDIFRA